jgi:cytidylate kinase
MAPRVVTIDGAAGSGKSTLARRLADALRLPYVNTGLMYRALAARALDTGVSPDDEAALVDVAAGLRFTLHGGTPDVLSVDGFDPEELVAPAVESTVSEVARHEGVRQLLRAEQRRLGEIRGAVMEGRDIGSVVFADAPVKLYLTAEPVVRASRRAGERGKDEASTATALQARDERDARTNPHEPSPDAAVIDTTDLDVDATLNEAMEIVRERAPELLP